MGNLQAAEMAEAVNDSRLDLYQAVSWNLTANHYPPIGEYAEIVTEVLIDLKRGDLSLDDSVALRDFKMVPSRAYTTDEGTFVQVSDLIDATHSWFFLED